MCRELCEQTEEGRMLWDRWRTHHDNWNKVHAFHHNKVLEAMREHARIGGTFTVFACERREGTHDAAER